MAEWHIFYFNIFICNFVRGSPFLRESLVLKANMATTFENVYVSPYNENEEFSADNIPLRQIELQEQQCTLFINVKDGKNVLQKFTVDSSSEYAKLGQRSIVVTSGNKSILLKFKSVKDLKQCESKLKAAKNGSVFSRRTDQASAEQYFQFYSYLSQQQNMMQDYVRTSTYQQAILNNPADFQDKIVMDVGAGSGILSFFAIQAGAKKVYAVEASSMVRHCAQLVKNNRLEDKIIVISGKIEEVEIPEKVDMIISEPMGYMLFNERMLETFLHAKKWLKPGGRMFPSQGDLHIAPFTDDSLYMEQFSKANFWYQPSFHGVDLSGLREAAVDEYFNQPIVDTFDVRICLARSQKYVVNFETAHETDLHTMNIPVSYTMQNSGTVHGLAFWFDVAFLGSQSTVWLSTAPTEPLTHWYQVRCLLKNPIFAKQGQTLSGTVLLQANERQSYDVTIELSIAGTDTKSRNVLDLKNPFFRYTGQQPAPPPGTNETSPSENYWAQQEAAHNHQYSAVEQVQANSFGVSSLLNGAAGDAQVIQPQTGAIQSNLVPLAPVNPGSIPAATIVNPPNVAQLALQTRTSVGGGISPNMLNQAVPSTGMSGSSSHNYPISNQFMIGDYVIPGNNMVLPTQGLNLK